MNYIERLQQAIRDLHGCESTHVESVPVRETHRGQTVWDGTVEVFDLIGHSKARRCYAWAHAQDGGSRYIAVLQIPPVTSPTTAVRAAIMEQVKADQRRQG